MDRVLYEARYATFFKFFTRSVFPIAFLFFSWAYAVSWGELEIGHRILGPFVIASFPLGFLDVNVQYIRFTDCRIVHRNLFGKVREYRYEDLGSFVERFNGVTLEMRTGSRIRIGKIMGDPNAIKTILQERALVLE